MDSIKFNAKGHSVEFSKRTLTIDNKVYSYTGISQVKHSSAYHAYLFRYNGEWVKLFYDESQGKVIASLFKKINAMNARRAAHARATQSIDTSAIAAALAGTDAPEEAKAPAPQEKIPAPQEEPSIEAPKAEAEAPAVDVPKAEAEAPAVEVPKAEAEAPAVEVPKAEAEVETPEAETLAETPEAEAITEAPEEVSAAETVSEEALAKKTRLKKAFIIFAIIIALFIIAGIIYFFTVGTTNDASQSPNVDETHQYNDIDELIEEMQE